jgi:hypothetical protein
MSSEPNKPRQGLTFSLRLSLFYAALFFIGYLAIFAIAEFFISSSIESKEREIVLERIGEYRAWFLSGSTTGPLLRFKEHCILSPTDLIFIRILGPGTDYIRFSSPPGQELLDVAQLDELAATDEGIVRTLFTGDPRQVWTVGTSSLPSNYILQAGKISTPEFRVLNTFRRTFLWAIIPVSLLAFGGGTSSAIAP